jgi:hypothetical protein
MDIRWQFGKCLKTTSGSTNNYLSSPLTSVGIRHKWYNRMMGKRFFALLVLTLFTVFLVAPSAFAARPQSPPSTPLGIDVSYPQCGKRLPTDQAFAVIGINGGNAATVNPCLSSQLAWGNRSAGGTNQAKLQLYVNTANPGEVIDQIQTWPASNQDSTGYTPSNTYGNTCSGANDLSCSWLYGWNRAVAAANQYFAPAAQSAGVSNKVSDYTWWLDVETMNTWQQGSEAALRRNVAALEGWVSYFENQSGWVGLYSTAYQWGEITGNFISGDSNLRGLPNWRPSGSTVNNAQANCTLSPLTDGGYISLTQFIKKGLDYNYSCV